MDEFEAFETKAFVSRLLGKSHVSTTILLVGCGLKLSARSTRLIEMMSRSPSFYCLFVSLLVCWK